MSCQRDQQASQKTNFGQKEILHFPDKHKDGEWNLVTDNYTPIGFSSSHFQAKITKKKGSNDHCNEQTVNGTNERINDSSSLKLKLELESFGIDSILISFFIVNGYKLIFKNKYNSKGNIE